MRCKGVVVVPNTTRWTGPWLGATRRPSLQRVANRPIVCHVLDTMLAAGIVDIAILASDDAIGEISACISAEGPPGACVHYLGLARDGSRDEALAAVAQFAGEAACVLHLANGMLGEPLERFAESLHRDSLDALLLVQDDGQETRRLRLVARRALSTAVDSSTPMPAGAGVCLLGPGALRPAVDAGRAAAEQAASAQADAAPCEQALDLGLVAQTLAREGGRVHTHAAQKWCLFDGDAHALLDMNRATLDRLDPEATTLDATDGNRFEGAIAIHPSACVSSSVIIGPAIIGADALIADSYIGPHTSIGERVRIEGSELERSIVLADASLLHVGGRLVASIVGREARIFRDFSMPRALRLQVGDGDEVALC